MTSKFLLPDMRKNIILFSLLLITSVHCFSQQWGDYTLYSVSGSTTATLVDTNGTVYKTWTGLTGKTGYSVYLTPGGTLIRTIATNGNSLSGGGMTGGVQKVDWNGNLLWNYTYSSSSYCLHHDICPMPNGNVLMISYEVKTAAEAVQAGSTTNSVIWSEKIIEVQPTGTTTGKIVWEWHLWDHLIQNTDAAKANYKVSITEHPELLNINYKTQKDWIHMNGIDYNPVLDQIAVSSHNLNEMFVIDHSTTTAEAASHTGGNSGKGGDFLYRWGNPASYGAGGTTNFNVIHDAHWIPEGVPDAGYLVGFNNKGTTSKSTIDRIKTPLNGYNYDLTTGMAYAPSAYTARHTCNGSTSNQGNSQQLPNGNMLVCIAMSGTIYEVSPSNSILWSMTATGTVSQAFRYQKCYVNTQAPEIPVISSTSGGLQSSAAASYQWYLNGQPVRGANSQSYQPSESGIYLVKTTNETGCVYQYSSGYKYAIVTGNTSSNEYNQLIRVYPNPSVGKFELEGNFTDQNFEILVYDIYGSLISRHINSKQIDLSEQPEGMYILSVAYGENQKINQRISVKK